MKTRVGIGAWLLVWAAGLGAPGLSGQQVARSSEGMVVTQHRLATEAGVEILEAGGNAVDAAVAAAFAMGVVDPFNAGIGGRAQILIRSVEGTFHGLDGTTQVPAGHDPASAPPRPAEELRIEAETGRSFGQDMVGIPGTVAALARALEAHGTLPLARVMEAAIRYAGDGVVVERSMLPSAPLAEGFLDLPGAPASLFRPDGSAYRTGDRYRQPELARTLQAIADGGPDAFYRGDLARTMAEDVAAHGGSLRYEDLVGYEVLESEIVRGSYRDHDLVGTYWPASGATTIGILQILDRLEPHGEADAAWAADIARAFHAAIADRYVANGSDEVDAEWLTSDSLASRRAREIRAAGELAPVPGDGVPDATEHTTHLSVTDRAGNAVALTQSLGDGLGSLVMTPELGFLYAMTMGYLDDEQPGARPGSSQSPLIVMREEEVRFVVGASGARRILTSIVQSLSRTLEAEEPFAVAVGAPRIYPTGPASMNVESRPDARWPDAILSRLQAAGWRTNAVDGPFGTLHGIAWDPESREWIGVADPRNVGTAGGPEPRAPRR